MIGVIARDTPAGWDFIKDLPNLRRLKFYYQKYDHIRHVDVVVSHPCFAPSALEFTGLASGDMLTGGLREHILDAVPSISPSQVRDLELAAASVEQDMRLNGYGDSKEVMRPTWSIYGHLWLASRARRRPWWWKILMM